MRSKTVPVNTYFSPDDSIKLTHLAARMNRTRSSLIRELVLQAYFMIFESRPKCASGRDCFVPQMHPTSQPPKELPNQEQLPHV